MLRTEMPDMVRAALGPTQGTDECEQPGETLSWPGSPGCQTGLLHLACAPPPGPLCHDTSSLVTLPPPRSQVSTFQPQPLPSLGRRQLRAPLLASLPPLLLGILMVADFSLLPGITGSPLKHEEVEALNTAF
ncbi:uncharacterized protein LOC144336686 [Macaca mulatta]